MGRRMDGWMDVNNDNNNVKIRILIFNKRLFLPSF